MTYRTGGARLKSADRIVLAGLRVALITLIAVCLFRPVLVVKAAVEQQNFVAVLLDDSRSMQIADHNGEPRANFVRQEFGAHRPRRAQDAVGPVHGADVPLLDGGVTSRCRGRTDVFRGADAARGRARRRAPGTGRAAAGRAGRGQRRRRHGRGHARRLAARRSSRRACRFSRSASAAKHCPRDIEIGRVSTPRFALKGTTLMIDVLISADRLCRTDGHARRRGRGPHRRLAAGDASRRRVGGNGAGALHAPRTPGRASSGSASRRRKASWSPRTTPRGDDRRARSPREDPLLPGRAARPTSAYLRAPWPTIRICSWCCCSAPPTTSTTGWRIDGRRRTARRDFRRRARSCSAYRARHPRQHRGGRVHRRSAADDRGVRRSPRRRADDARRRAVVLRRRLCRHRRRRRASAGARSQRAQPATRVA